MRTFFGMILGCLLTIAVVYLHDTRVSGPTDSTSFANRPIVNWDVANGEWTRVTENVKLSWDRLVNSDRRKT